MNALPAESSYQIDLAAAECRIAEIREAKAAAAEPAAEANPGTWFQLGARVAAYAACGLGLFAAFCTKLSVACEYFYAVPPEQRWMGCAFLLASTIATGLLLDRLIRSNWNFVLVASAWVAVNSVTTPLLAFVVGMAMSPGRGIYSSPQNITLGFLMCIFYGLIIGVMCLHLSLPICSVCVLLARRLGTEQEPAKD